MIYAKYTIVLKTLLDDPQTKALIDEALSTYPLYTPEFEKRFTQILTREEINEKILNHFKYREIGFETVGRFIDELKITMEEIMPTYNQYLCSEDIINGLENIFDNVDVKVVFEEEKTGQTDNDTTSSSSSSSNGSDSSTLEQKTTNTGSSSSSGSDQSASEESLTGDSKNVTSETPQSQLSITANDIDNVEYADKVNWNKDNTKKNISTNGSTSSESSSEGETDLTGTSTNTKNETSANEGTIKEISKVTETLKNTLTRKGNHGVNTYAHDMLEFRELFLNVVQMIIKDPRMQELFMGVY